MKFTNYRRKQAEDLRDKILNAKPIEIWSEDGERVQYTLEFSRTTAAELEESGFEAEQLGKGKVASQMKHTLMLFIGAFRMHHADDTDLFTVTLDDGQPVTEADEEFFEKLLYSLDTENSGVLERLLYLYYKPTVALTSEGNKKRKIR